MSAKEVLMAAAGSAGALPSFISSSSSQQGGPSITITAPTGIQNGDLLLVVLVTESGTGTATPPTGVNLVRQNQIASASASLHIGSKIASSESGDYTFTTSSTGNKFGAILVYRNATSVNTLGVAAAPSTNGAAGVIAAGITPTFTGTLIGLWGHFGASKTLSTPPSGMTQRVANTTSKYYYIYDLSNQPDSATGDKALVWGGASSDLAPNILFQITNEPTVAPEFIASASTQNSGTGTTLTINKPTGTLENDLMVAIMGASNPVSAWSGDTGWTEIVDDGANSPALRIAYKVAGASETSTYTFTTTSPRPLGGSILTYRYAAYDTIGALTANTDPLVLPSVSATQSQSFLIATAMTGGSPRTYTTPTSMTLRILDTIDGPCYMISDQLVAKGPSGTRSTANGAASTNTAGIMLSIKPTRSL